MGYMDTSQIANVSEILNNGNSIYIILILGLILAFSCVVKTLQLIILESKFEKSFQVNEEKIKSRSHRYWGVVSLSVLYVAYIIWEMLMANDSFFEIVFENLEITIAEYTQFMIWILVASIIFLIFFVSAILFVFIYIIIDLVDLLYGRLYFIEPNTKKLPSDRLYFAKRINKKLSLFFTINQEYFLIEMKDIVNTKFKRDTKEETNKARQIYFYKFKSEIHENILIFIFMLLFYMGVAFLTDSWILFCVLVFIYMVTYTYSWWQARKYMVNERPIYKNSSSKSSNNTDMLEYQSIIMNSDERIDVLLTEQEIIDKLAITLKEMGYSNYSILKEYRYNKDIFDIAVIDSNSRKILLTIEIKTLESGMSKKQILKQFVKWKKFIHPDASQSVLCIVNKDSNIEFYVNGNNRYDDFSFISEHKGALADSKEKSLSNRIKAFTKKLNKLTWICYGLAVFILVILGIDLFNVISITEIHLMGLGISGILVLIPLTGKLKYKDFELNLIENSDNED